LDANLLAVADFDPAYAAFTGTAGSDIPVGMAAIVVNNGSAFFRSGYSVNQGKITGGTALAQAFILLHELAHAVDADGFLPDRDDRHAGMSNDRKIEQNCDKTLRNFQ
jgi:hypothetical protein